MHETTSTADRDRIQRGAGTCPPALSHRCDEIEPHWEARCEHGTLHISGSATTFPNDHSTASLARQPDDGAFPELLVYRVVFHRDKEPFSDADLLGPVHYFERFPIGNTRGSRPRPGENVRAFDCQRTA